MKFRKKPVVIDAVVWTGDNKKEIEDFCPKADFSMMSTIDCSPWLLRIETLEGTHRAEHGDYIIRGVKGEYYPCKPDIFEMTYEPAE
jgi:hypothetical protein